MGLPLTGRRGRRVVLTKAGRVPYRNEGNPPLSRPTPGRSARVRGRRRLLDRALVDTGSPLRVFVRHGRALGLRLGQTGHRAGKIGRLGHVQVE